MSLFFRRPQPTEDRAITTLDWVHGSDLDTPSTADAALSVIPVFAACRLIADSVATLPLQTYRKTDDAREPIATPTVFSGETSIEWLQQAVMSLLLYGNAYGLVTRRDNKGRPLSVTWLDPKHVTVDETGPLPIFFFQGRQLERMDVKHIPAYSVAGTVVGLSPIQACSGLVATGQATQKMNRDWFAGRAIPGVIAKNTAKTLDPSAAEVVQERLTSRLRNGRPFVTGSDWDITVMAMPADDAGFISSAKLNATQVAAIYGIPPEMIGGETGSSLTYSTVELNMLNFATFTLRPWLAKLEQEFSAWLGLREFVKFNIDAMIRVDTKTRYEVHKIAREIGLNSIDELRALEDSSPLPDGKGEDYTPLGTAPAVKESLK